jgi:hypothetical protein
MDASQAEGYQLTRPRMGLLPQGLYPTSKPDTPNLDCIGLCMVSRYSDVSVWVAMMMATDALAAAEKSAFLGPKPLRHFCFMAWQFSSILPRPRASGIPFQPQMPIPAQVQTHCR